MAGAPVLKQKTKIRHAAKVWTIDEIAEAGSDPNPGDRVRLKSSDGHHANGRRAAVNGRKWRAWMLNKQQSQ